MILWKIKLLKKELTEKEQEWKCAQQKLYALLFGKQKKKKQPQACRSVYLAFNVIGYHKIYIVTLKKTTSAVAKIKSLVKIHLF